MRWKKRSMRTCSARRRASAAPRAAAAAPMAARRPAKSPRITGGGRGGREVPGGERPGLRGGAQRRAARDRDRGARIAVAASPTKSSTQRCCRERSPMRQRRADSSRVSLLVNGLVEDAPALARAPRAARTSRPGTAPSRRRPAARRPRSWQPPRAGAARGSGPRAGRRPEAPAAGREPPEPPAPRGRRPPRTGRSRGAAPARAPPPRRRRAAARSGGSPRAP